MRIKKTARGVFAMARNLGKTDVTAEWDNAKWDNTNAGLLRTWAEDSLHTLAAPPRLMAGTLALAESLRREITRDRVGRLAREAVRDAADTVSLYANAAKRGWNSVGAQETAPELTRQRESLDDQMRQQGISEEGIGKHQRVTKPRLG